MNKLSQKFYGSLASLLLALLAAVLIAPAAPAQGRVAPVPPAPRTPASAAPPYAPGQLIVRLRDAARLGRPGFDPTAAFQAQFASLPLTAATAIAPATYRLDLPATADIPALARQLAADPRVGYAEPNYRRQVRRTVDDPLSSFQYGLQKVDAFGAWDLSTGFDGTVIAVLDSGVDARHPDLAGRVLPGYNFVQNNRNAADDNGHGTQSAGVAAAAGGNGEGIAGMCWQCRILPVKVTNADGAATSEWIARGIRWAADQGARVINLSLSDTDGSAVEHEAIRYAVSRGVLVVAAAGNSFESGNPVEYPAAYDEVLAVGATDQNDQRASFSSVHPYVDLAAPGVNIASAWPTTVPPPGPYRTDSGTSMSAPFVAGLAGLLFSANPSLTADQVRWLILNTVDDLGQPGPDAEYGAGRINAARALSQVRPTAFAPLPNPNLPNVAYFPETQHSLRGVFKQFWEQNGGLAVFGLPITEAFQERSAEGVFLVQYFERNRFEYHPENAAPYNVLLGRLSDVQLKRQGRDWFTFTKGQAADGCQFFPQTGHSVCEPFLSYWKRNGLRDPKLSPDGRSLALFGLPLSEATLERNSSGDEVLTQWFERARFEFHPNKPPEFQVLLGLLGNETVDIPPPPAPPATQAPPDRCGQVAPPVAATVTPGTCVVVGTTLLIDASGFVPGEAIRLSIIFSSGVVPVDPGSVGQPLQADGAGRFRLVDRSLPYADTYGYQMEGAQSGQRAVVTVKTVDR